MKVRLTTILLFVTSYLWSQPNVTYIEYYIDTIANPTSLSFVPDTEVEVSFGVNTTGLENGLHFLITRARDENNAWGMIETRPFFIIASGTPDDFSATGLDRIEYYVDDDPGLGSGIEITGFGTGDLNFETSFLFDTDGLSVGVHTIQVRARNTDGEWGIIETRPFHVLPSGTPELFPANQVTEVQYFIDDISSPTTLYTSSGDLEVSLNELIPVGTTEGVHFLGVRAKNDQGIWGIYEIRPFWIKNGVGVDESQAPGSPVTRLEYYFNDTDPGVGNAMGYDIVPPTTDVDFTGAGIDIPTPTDIPVGFNTISIRALSENGRWGETETRQFEVIDDCDQPVPSFTAQLACAGEVVNFMDQSTMLQPDASYEWDFDGDGLTDNTTTGDVSHTYTIPGTYDVTLRIQQGQICDQSYTETITIIEKPVVFFSATGNTVNEETTFDVESENIPLGATWSWDFDDDAIEDSNSPGPSLTFTYTSIGSYDPIVTVTNGLGCQDTFTRNVVIQDSGGTGGGNGGSPSVQYSVNTICLGESTSFIDQSQNIPDEATYSWSFGDGESSSFKGSTNHLYETPGIFTSKLTVDFGAGVTEEFERAVEVVAIPSVAFEVNPTCVTANVQFIDNSTDVLGDAIYSWDFDNDGNVDSNVKGVTEFKYDQPGNYIAKLIIDNGNGCFDELTAPVTVLQEPVADFSFEFACVGEEISFTDLSTGLEPSAVYSWDLDGDDVEDFNQAMGVIFTYDTPGDYTIKLTVKNDDICISEKTLVLNIPERPIADFEIIARCYGQVSEVVDLSEKVAVNATYSWDLDGDGTEDDTTPGNTSFTYPEFASYIATLIVDNGSGCISSSDFLVFFKDAAQPDFEVTPSCVNQETIFTDLSSELEVGAKYSWDFDGDGLEDSAEPGSVSFVYRVPGTYNALLTVDNGNQCLAFKEVSVEVTAAPAVTLGVDRQLCSESPELLDPGPGYETYQWSTGETSQSITVDTFGDYTVLVTDIKGCINRDTISVKLKDDPIADFDYSVRLSPTDGFLVSFINLSTGVNDTSAVFEWKFGLDEPTLLENELNPTVAYNEFFIFSGTTYEVCLKVTDRCGTTSEICKPLFLSPTAFDEEDLEWLKVYPNPGNGLFNIDIDRNRQIDDFKVFSSNGVMVWERKNENLSSFDIDLRNEGRGVYIVFIESDGAKHFKRLVVR